MRTRVQPGSGPAQHLTCWGKVEVIGKYKMVLGCYEQLITRGARPGFGNPDIICQNSTTSKLFSIRVLTKCNKDIENILDVAGF